jgi:hypothetical protein
MFIYQNSGQAFHIGLDRLYNCFTKALGFSLKDVVLAEVTLHVIPCISEVQGECRVCQWPFAAGDSQSASASTTGGSVSCHRSVYLVPSAKYESEVDAGRRRTQYNKNGTMLFTRIMNV